MQRTWWLLWKPFWKIRNYVVCFFIYPFLDLFNLLKQKSHRWLCEKIGFQSRFKKKSKWCYSNQCKFLLIILNKIYASENIDIFQNFQKYVLPKLPPLCELSCAKFTKKFATKNFDRRAPLGVILTKNVRLSPLT